MCISLSSITYMYDSLVNYAYEKLYFLYLGFSRKFGININNGIISDWPAGQIDPFSTMSHTTSNTTKIIVNIYMMYHSI